MELTEETLEHLRSEALVGLCRERIEARHREVERTKEELAGRRGPLSLFSKRTSKDALQRQRREVEATLENLQHQLAVLREIEGRVTAIIRGDLELFLESSSEDYQQLSTHLRKVDVWQRKLRESGEFLTAFARELRELQSAAAGGQRTRAVAAVREAAHRLAALHAPLATIAWDIAVTLGNKGNEPVLTAPAELNRLAWVQRLSVLPSQQLEVESAYVETETRRFIASGLEAVCASAEPCRQALQARADAYLDHYWEQLRAYAKEHLAREFDVETTVADLATRYIDAALERYQVELAATPFLITH